MKPIILFVSDEKGNVTLPLKELSDIIKCSYEMGLLDAKREIKEHFMTWKHGKQILNDIDDVMSDFYERYERITE